MKKGVVRNRKKGIVGRMGQSTTRQAISLRNKMNEIRALISVEEIDIAIAEASMGLEHRELLAEHHVQGCKPSHTKKKRKEREDVMALEVVVVLVLER